MNIVSVVSFKSIKHVYIYNVLKLQSVVKSIHKLSISQYISNKTTIFQKNILNSIHV